MEKIVDIQDVLSVKDISRILGIGINQARALVYRSDFPSIQIGKKKRIVPKNVFYDWLNTKAIGKKYIV